MKKLYVTILMSLFVVGGVSAQKYIKGNKKRITFVQSPLNYKLQDYKTYYIEPLNVYDKNTVLNVIKFPGFELVDTKEKAGFIVRFTQLKFDVTPKKLNTTKNNKTRKDGSKYTEYSYTYSTTISIDDKIEVLSKSGEVIDSQKKSFVKKYETLPNKDTKAAYNSFNKKIDGWKKNLAKQASYKTVQFIHDRYCYLTKSYLASFVGFKFKKHDYSMLNEKAAEINLKLGEEEKSKVKSEETKELVNNYIKILEEELKKYDSTNKKARINGKIKGGLLFNIGLGYMYLLDYEKTLDYMTQANEFNDSVEGCQKRLIKATKRNLGIVEDKKKG